MNKRKDNFTQVEEPAKQIKRDSKILIQFENNEGSKLANTLNLNCDIGPQGLNLILNQLLENEEPLPYLFKVGEDEVSTSILEDILQKNKKGLEDTITILYQPQAIFKVKPVTRCSSTLNGHTEAILTLKFSPDGKYLATGSGDTTIRLWDLATDTPKQCLQGHKSWVLMLEWSPDGNYLASGGMDNTVIVWDIQNECKKMELKGHRKWVSDLAWEPYHINSKTPRLASGSKDGTIRVWNPINKTTIFTLSGHTSSVTCIKWGGGGLNSSYKKGVIYSASQDRSIKLWCGETGKLITSLDGHAHWVNSLALSTDFVLRTGPFDHHCRKLETIENAPKVALERYEQCLKDQGIKEEILVSGSDDFTMYLWNPFKNNKPIQRMTGHQKLINQVQFSPDGRYIASASFDKSIKLWDGKTGNFIHNLRSHVQSVYQLAFSSDSRLIISCSKDSTAKIFDLKSSNVKVHLPGHLDEVYTIDWSPKGDKVASGGKDKLLKIWRN
ncbi:putative notchless protein [Neoconidiobolus thromboides FSU 785]|nr:putative notchless protein [Neoconidiobolus thromboides FSU 785]